MTIGRCSIGVEPGSDSSNRAGVNGSTPGMPDNFYFQDDWKVTRRLNLNIGVRNDYYGPVAEKSGLLTSITWGPGDNYDQRLANAVAGVPYNQPLTATSGPATSCTTASA